MCLITSALVCKSGDLTEVRNVFHKAVLDEDNISAFYEYMLKQDTSDATLKAYMATAEALKAKLYWDPFRKMTQVNKFVDLIDEAVAKDDMSIEVRFLRLCVEYHLPKILNHSQHILEDKNYIMDNLADINNLNFDAAFAKYILYFMNENGLCTGENIADIEKELK